MLKQTEITKPMNDSQQSIAKQHNRDAWNRMVAGKKRFTQPAKDGDLNQPLHTVDAIGWLGGDIAGKKVLCLAAGGGRQSAIYAATGAKVTVVDISPAMLELDREVAAERGFDLQVVETSMDDLSMFTNQEFDIVVHPVSTCYLPSIGKVFSEIARVTIPGGLYISQHKQPTSLQTGMKRSQNGYELIEPYYRTGPLPPVQGTRLREDGTMEFLHRWEEIIGGICRNGFVIEDLVEPFHADPNMPWDSFGDRCCYTAPYVRIKARRNGTRIETTPANKIFLPE